MQRAVVIFAVFLLVAAALAAGALASHWPFWVRAWQWQVAADGYPDHLPGPARVLRGGAAALPLQFEADPQLQSAAAEGATWILLRAGVDGRGGAWSAAGFDPASMVDGRGLATGLLAPLVGVLSARHPALLDTAVGDHVESLRSGPLGAITPRQLLWQLSGLPAGEFRPLNPASRRAQLASGPDFERAVVHWQQPWPAGSHFEKSPANAQLLAVLAARLADARYAEVLEVELWSRLAAADAVALLDHPRGDIAAHCCLRAAAADWLRLGLMLADDGRIGALRLLPSGFVGQMATESPVHPGYGLGYRIADDAAAGRILILETTGRQLLIAPALRRAVMWVGKGPPPARLHKLLSATAASNDDKSVK
jgi:CubicO group peptidase (beta-lactamase class C family)